jgi:CheY-like chemotaxis protein
MRRSARPVARRRSTAPRTIISDQRLGPGLTGNAAATEMARRAGRALPTLLVTGDTAENRLAEAFSSGFVVLHKPVDAGDLRRSLTSLLLGAARKVFNTTAHDKTEWLRA